MGLDAAAGALRSPDGRWWWDGTTWRPTEQGLDPAAGALRSPDGRWWWDGTSWRPTEQGVDPADHPVYTARGGGLVGRNVFVRSSASMGFGRITVYTDAIRVTAGYFSAQLRRDQITSIRVEQALFSKRLRFIHTNPDPYSRQVFWFPSSQDWPILQGVLIHCGYPLT